MFPGDADAHYGARNVWARNSAEPGALMGLVNAEHITFMPSPPTVLQAMLAHPSVKRDLGAPCLVQGQFRQLQGPPLSQAHRPLAAQRLRQGAEGRPPKPGLRDGRAYARG